MINEVKEILETQGYLHRNKIYDDPNILSGFNEVYIEPKKRELYILISKNVPFTYEEIKEYQQQVSGFITLYASEILAFNINLLLFSPIGYYNKKEKDDYIDLVNSIERNKSYCRKIFLDTMAQDKDRKAELSILPFVPISFSETETDNNKEDSELDCIFSCKEDLYKELLKDKSDIRLEKILDCIEISKKGE